MDAELKLVVDYNFQLKLLEGRAEFLDKCISAQELAVRLWNNFRWKGLIHPEVEYMSVNSSNWEVVHEDFLRQVMAARQLGLKQPHLMSSAKEIFRRQAVQSLGVDTLEDVFDKYSLDYEMFDFDEDKQKLMDLVS